MERADRSAATVRKVSRIACSLASCCAHVNDFPHRRDIGEGQALFQTHIVGGAAFNRQGRQYDVARDGRFLINTVLDEATAPITLLLNWEPAAKSP